MSEPKECEITLLRSKYRIVPREDSDIYTWRRLDDCNYLFEAGRIRVAITKFVGLWSVALCEDSWAPGQLDNVAPDLHVGRFNMIGAPTLQRAFEEGDRIVDRLFAEVAKEHAMAEHGCTPPKNGSLSN